MRKQAVQRMIKYFHENKKHTKTMYDVTKQAPVILIKDYLYSCNLCVGKLYECSDIANCL